MKIRGSYETEIYPTEGGYVAIKQIDPMDEDQLVLLAPEQIPMIIKELQELYDDRASWESEPERDD